MPRSPRPAALAIYLLFLIGMATTAYMRPVFMPDIVPYAAITLSAHEPDMRIVQKDVFANVAREMGDDFAYAGGTPWWRDMRENPYRLAEQFPFFSIKPLYISTLILLNRAGLNVFNAAHLVSAVSLVGIGLVLLLWTKKPLYSALLLLAPSVIAIGRSPTPDALSTFVVLTALYQLLRQREGLGLGLLAVSVFIRTDNVILLMLCIAWLVLTSRIQVWHATALAATAVASVQAINHFGGSYGWQKLIANNPPLLGPGEVVVHVSTAYYARLLYLGLRSAPSGTEICIWVMVALVAYRWATSKTRQLLLVVGCSMAAHFLLYPSPQDRYFAWAYLMAGTAFIFSAFSILGRDLPEHAGVGRSPENLNGGIPENVRLSIVLPAFNEQAALSQVISEHAEIVKNLKGVAAWEIVCVDDASTDGTPAVLSALRAQIPELVVMKHERNEGIFTSFRTGFRTSRYDYIYATGSDGQWPVENLAIMFAQLRAGADLVVGVRTNRRQVYSPARQVVSFLFNALTRLMLGVQVADAGAVKLGRRDLFDIDLVSESVFVEAERILYAFRAGYKVAFVPIKFRARTAGRAHGAALQTIVAAMKDLWRCYLRYGRLRKRFLMPDASKPCAARRVDTV